MQPIKPLEADNYRVFSKEWNEEPHIFFHGTTQSAYEAIIQNGFIKGKKTEGTSFSNTDGIALKYACDNRDLKNQLDPAVVIAVHFKILIDLADEGSVFQFYKHDFYNSNTNCDSLKILDYRIICNNFP